MHKTTIPLPDDLNERIAVAAERAGTSFHDFILDAIAEKLDREAQHEDCIGMAERRYAQIAASGKTIPWSEMRTYLEGLVTCKALPRPAPRTQIR